MNAPSSRHHTRIGVVVLALLSGCSRAPGRLEIEPSEVELSIEDGLSHERDLEVVLRNVGEAALEIVEVAPSCECTVPGPLAKTRLAPGETVSMPLHVSLPAFGQDDSAVMIRTDSSAHPTGGLTLHLRGERQPVPYLVRMSGRAEMTGAMPGEEIAAECEVLTAEDPSAEPWVLALASSDADVHAELTERVVGAQMSETAARYAYRFRLRGPTPHEAVATSSLELITSTDPPSGALPRISVIRRYAPPLRPIPGELAVQCSPEHPTAQCRLAIAVDDEEPFEVDVDAATDWLALSEQPSASGARKSLRLLLLTIDIGRCKAAAGAATPEIVLRTTHPKRPEIRVPLHILD